MSVSVRLCATYHVVSVSVRFCTVYCVVSVEKQQLLIHQSCRVAVCSRRGQHCGVGEVTITTQCADRHHLPSLWTEPHHHHPHPHAQPAAAATTAASATPAAPTTTAAAAATAALTTAAAFATAADAAATDAAADAAGLFESLGGAACECRWTPGNCAEIRLKHFSFKTIQFD